MSSDDTSADVFDAPRSDDADSEYVYDDMTQQDLADSVGLSRSRLADIVSGSS